jgi:hypothetical protein
METDLHIRLRTYLTTAETQVPSGTARYADALTSSRAASVAASASIVCSHTRELSGSDPGDTAERPRLPLRPGNGSVASLALGAEGIPAIKSQNA